MGNSYHIGRGREVQKCNFKSEQYQFLLKHFLEGSILCSKFMTPLLQDRCTMFFHSINVITCTYLELDSQKSFLPSGNSSILILPTLGGELFALHE